MLGPTASNIFVVVYLMASLFLRFYFEPQLKDHFFVSIGIGLFALLFLWALIKSNVIKPTLFSK
jgi:hypothetical protein